MSLLLVHDRAHVRFRKCATGLARRGEQKAGYKPITRRLGSVARTPFMRKGSGQEQQPEDPPTLAVILLLGGFSGRGSVG